MLKKFKRKVSIILILMVAMLLVSTTCHAATETIPLQSTTNINELTSQINNALRKYGYSGGTYNIASNSNSSFQMEWKANNMNYTARISITYQNGVYSGNIKVNSTTGTIIEEDAPSTQPLPSGSNPTVNPDYWQPSANTDNQLLVNIGNVIIGIIRTIGTVIAVVVIMILGIKYMFGTVEEKANYKGTMIPYLIGAIMLFTIPNIVGIIYDLVKQINF